MEDVARANLSWAEERWDDLKNFLPEKLYDEGFPKEEQLPREFTVEFRQAANGKIQMFINGEQLGNPYTKTPVEQF